LTITRDIGIKKRSYLHMADSGKKIYIGVIGAGHCTKKLRDLASEVGKEIASQGAILVCGGLDGIMMGAAQGAKSADGVTIGVLPGTDKRDANEFIDYVVCSGFGEARNLIIIRTADAVIALPGMFGTLSELGFALKMKKPVISLGSWEVSDAIIKAKDAKEAVKLAIQAVRK
jgi:uncharacterized protein (TIGR00725 family)